MNGGYRGGDVEDKIHIDEMKSLIYIFNSYGIYFHCIQMEFIARDIIDICWGVGLDSLSKLVTHDSFVMQVTSRWETLL